MANLKVSEQKSGGGRILSCLWWLVSLTTKVSILVAMVALLVTVHQMRNSNLENVLLLQRAQVDVGVATQQKEAATLAHTKANSHLNQLQTDLAKVRNELQQLQQTAAAQRLDVQKEADRHAQEAKSAKQENLVLIQKLNDAEASSRKQQVEGSQQTQEVLEGLQNDKQSLEQRLTLLQSTAEQRAVELMTATEKLQQVEQQLQQISSKATHEAHINEQLHAKEKAQDMKINELSETIKRLEEAAKVKT